MNCPNKKQNAEECTCTYNCQKKGLCCDCVKYHRSRGELPGCFFSTEGEATYDRSIANFIKDKS